MRVSIFATSVLAVACQGNASEKPSAPAATAASAPADAAPPTATQPEPALQVSITYCIP